jgi:hypothetical protein
MSFANEFRRHLDDLHMRRSHWLRSPLDSARPGRPPGFKAGHRDQVINRLQEISSEALAEQIARSKFDESVAETRRWHVRKSKGRTYNERKRTFVACYDQNITTPHAIYVFWSQRGCEYVGSTTGGGRRPANHFEKAWFRSVHRIDVYATTGRRPITALECLAKHRFLPIQNKITPTQRKRTSTCFLCDVHRSIDAELRVLFPLR